MEETTKAQATANTGLVMTPVPAPKDTTSSTRQAVSAGKQKTDMQEGSEDLIKPPETPKHSSTANATSALILASSPVGILGSPTLSVSLRGGRAEEKAQPTDFVKRLGRLLHSGREPTILSLPQELLLDVFDYLDIHDYRRMFLCCQKLNRAASSPKSRYHKYRDITLQGEEGLLRTIVSLGLLQLSEHRKRVMPCIRSITIEAIRMKPLTAASPPKGASYASSENARHDIAYLDTLTLLNWVQLVYAISSLPTHHSDGRRPSMSMQESYEAWFSESVPGRSLEFIQWIPLSFFPGLVILSIAPQKLQSFLEYLAGWVSPRNNTEIKRHKDDWLANVPEPSQYPSSSSRLELGFLTKLVVLPKDKTDISSVSLSTLFHCTQLPSLTSITMTADYATCFGGNVRKTLLLKDVGLEDCVMIASGVPGGFSSITRHGVGRYTWLDIVEQKNDYIIAKENHRRHDLTDYKKLKQLLMGMPSKGDTTEPDLTKFGDCFRLEHSTIKDIRVAGNFSKLNLILSFEPRRTRKGHGKVSLKHSMVFVGYDIESSKGMHGIVDVTLKFAQ
ncbi:uncharacterized protein KY384_003511 [Bacidia gigantensis]|uniref:uncharacterized protein n=1 Tax=Bacidia gigantensis TaxID=2732470 RepID=UPI001D0415D3|nr:uncharacterized protein KY384_003511 [Bacidia gigantensis]KAG8531875.1 hypothetical protein KY384_003511 [Bacidia gigantensis]